jgi:hypothetical protein
MSDIMYDDAPIPWRSYSIHDEKNIKGLFGDYRFFSNFVSCNIVYDGLVYQSSETAYQSAKIVPNERFDFTTMRAYDSKKNWKLYTPLYAPEIWDSKKYDIMYNILLDKFTRNPLLGEMLKETGNKYIEETNHWSDIFWGVDYKTGIGENNLGKILMGIRSKI